MAVRTYDPKEVVVLVGGIPIGGFADGSAVSVSRANDTFSKVSGTDGITSRAKSNDKSGEIALTLAQTSPSNDVLSGFAIADELSNNGVVPVAITDLSGRTVLVSAFAWVRKPPDTEFAKEISDREWMLDAADLDMFVGGNPDAE
jgi:hypothetical protein